MLKLYEQCYNSSAILPAYLTIANLLRSYDWVREGAGVRERVYFDVCCFHSVDVF